MHRLHPNFRQKSDWASAAISGGSTKDRSFASCGLSSVLPSVSNSAKTIRMRNLSRRQFIQRTSLAGAALLTAPHMRAASSEHSIEILLNEPIGTISPDLYGHFTE